MRPSYGPESVLSNLNASKINFWAKLKYRGSLCSAATVQGELEYEIQKFNYSLRLRVKSHIFPECNCNVRGSTNKNACDQTTGFCTCKPGWIGNKCQGKPANFIAHTNKGLTHNSKIHILALKLFQKNIKKCV